MMMSLFIPPVGQLSGSATYRHTATGMIGVRIIFYQPFTVAMEILHLDSQLSV
jgi:hypothetical protein